MTTRKLSQLAIAAVAVLAIANTAPALAQHAGGGGGFHGGGGGFHGGGGSFHGSGAVHGGVQHYQSRGGYRGGAYGGAYGRGYGWRGGGYGWGGYGGAGWLGYGLFFAALPLVYSTYYWDGVPYYYADDNYYQWDSTAGEYETVQPPAAIASQAAAAPPAQLFAYPTNGQSAEQQTKDRRDCEQWATGQAGSDAAKRDDYLKAEAACLTGKGYSVR
jgi:hypothetical protein